MYGISKQEQIPVLIFKSNLKKDNDNSDKDDDVVPEVVQSPVVLHSGAAYPSQSPSAEHERPGTGRNCYTNIKKLLQKLKY